MSGRVSSKQQLESEVRRSQILELRLKEKLNQFQIAERMGITQSAVSKNLAKAKEEFRQFRWDLLDADLAFEVDKCNDIEVEARRALRAAWRSWKKSIGVVKVTRKIAKVVRTQAAPNKDGTHQEPQESMRPEKMETREEIKVGNAALMSAILKAIERIDNVADRRCHLLGFIGGARSAGDQPRKNDRAAIPADMTNSDLMKEVFEFFNEFGSPKAPGGGNGDKGNGSHGPN